MTNCIEQDSLSNRRSVYALGRTLPVSDNCFIETVKACVKHCPTPFNVQSARIAVLFGKYHQKLWDITEYALTEITAGEKRATMKKRMSSFKQAYGTILFFEDKKSLSHLKKTYPLYAKNMRIWTQQANGMLQYMIWQTLSENDIGASLQHYNELIAEHLSEFLELPKNWELVAEMPFGSIDKEPAEKTFLPLDERIKIFK